MPDELRIHVANRLDELERAEAEMSAFLDARRVPAGRRYAASLALEEMLTNIIKYGYDDAAEHRIDIRVESGEKDLALTIEDDGHPFDPTALAEPDTSRRVEDRTVGGLGIHLVRKLTDGMTWRREGGKNIVRIRIQREG